MIDASSLNPDEKKMYEQEYRHSAGLFQKALTQYRKAENPYQQAQFKDVMDRAIEILNEAARGLMRQELQRQNEAISKDYATFQKHPTDPDTVNKLNHDLEMAKKSVS